MGICNSKEANIPKPKATGQGAGEGDPAGALNVSKVSLYIDHSIAQDGNGEGQSVRQPRSSNLRSTQLIPSSRQPQPDERITQAEYEKVVKGARLTDPVEEPISRSCTKSITSLIFHNDNPVYTCDSHIHTVNDNGNESSLIDCNKHT